MKYKGLEPSPDAVVSRGGFEYGRFGTPFRRANLLDIHRPYHYPLPRFVKDFRLKEWQTFTFGDERWYFFAALYNAKLVSVAMFQAYDRAAKRRFGVQRIVPGSVFRFGETLADSRIAYRGSRTFLEFAFDLGKDEARVNVVRNSRDRRRRFSGHFRFALAAKAAAPQSVCFPLGMNRAMYSTKALAPLRGDFIASGESYAVSGPSAMGIAEDSKGFYPWRMRYDWVCGYGLDPKGRRVGFSLADYQVRDQARHNENCLWINNRVWPLPPVKITRPHGHEKEWIVQDTEGMVDLVFVPETKNDIRFRLGVIDGDFHGPCGSFQGLIKNADGEKVAAEALFGSGVQKYLRA